MPKTGGKGAIWLLVQYHAQSSEKRKFSTVHEILTKIAVWNEKWIYMVTHFVSRNRVKPQPGCLQRVLCERNIRDVAIRPQERSAFASAITRMAFKSGAMIVQPICAMKECGLLQGAGTQTSSCGAECAYTDTSEEVEARRKRNLPIVELRQGWDMVYELFNEQETVLAGLQIWLGSQLWTGLLKKVYRKSS